MKTYSIALALVVGLAACGKEPEALVRLRLATTTSTENSGLLGHMLEPFQELSSAAGPMRGLEPTLTFDGNYVLGTQRVIYGPHANPAGTPMATAMICTASPTSSTTACAGRTPDVIRQGSKDRKTH